jgi:hypothetical protein
MLPKAVVRAAPRVVVVATVLLLAGLGTAIPKAAVADGSNCVDTCVAAFGVSFTNSRGDFFLLNDCATSDITGTTFCVYRRFVL